jgi:outer membrane murein-binding lipoprotein Lpp
MLITRYDTGTSTSSPQIDERLKNALSQSKESKDVILRGFNVDFVRESSRFKFVSCRVSTLWRSDLIILFSHRPHFSEDRLHCCCCCCCCSCRDGVLFPVVSSKSYLHCISNIKEGIMSAYARFSMLPIKKSFRTENGSNGTEQRGGRNKRTSSPKPGRSVRQKSALTPNNSLIRPASRTNRAPPPVTPRRPATANATLQTASSNQENHHPFSEASTLIVPGAEANFQDLSQLSMGSQDTSSIAQPTPNHDSATLTHTYRNPPPLRQQSFSAAPVGTHGGSTLYSQATYHSQDSFQKSTSSRVSFATEPTDVSTHRSRSSRVSVGVSATRNVAVAVPYPGIGSRCRQVSRQNLLPPTTPYHRPMNMNRSILRPTPRPAPPSSTSTLTHSSAPAGSSRYPGTQSSISGPALHQSSWGSGRPSSTTSVVSSKLSSASTSMSASQQDSREQVDTGSEDRIKTLVKAVLDAQHSDRLEQFGTKEALLDGKMKELEDAARLFDERLATANEVHTERVQELDSKKQELDKKVSKVAAMIKVAEGTAAKVSQLADNAVAAIGKSCSDLVESALPFLKNPVAKMVESFFADLQAKASAENLLSKASLSTKSPPPKLSPAPLVAVVKTAKTVSASQISKKSKNRKLDASHGKNDLKRSAPKKSQGVSSTSPKRTSTPSTSSSNDFKSLLSPSNKTSFKPLTLVGIRATTMDVDDDDDEGIFTVPKKKQSCVTPCHKASQQSLLDYDLSDLSQDSSCCSPLATKKRNEPLLPKRGRSKKPRNTYGGGSRRPSAGVLKDNFSFL